MRPTLQARTRCVLLVTLTVAPLAAASAQKRPPHDSSAHHQARRSTPDDSAFRGLQDRGRRAMGVDQYTSTHRFDDLRAGGRIELQRDAGDSTGTATIRAHLRAIKAAFESGDFSIPAFVHMRSVPGTKVMTERRSHIRYEVRDLPRGAELRITTTDPTALAAVHEFMAFQRGDHRAAGTDLHRKP